MSAVEEWEAVRPEANNIMPRLAGIADAAIAELEVELEESEKAEVTLIDDYNRDFAKPLLDAERRRAEDAEGALGKANRHRANTEWNAMVRQSDENLARAEQAEAELAKFKSQLCDGCGFD